MTRPIYEPSLSRTDRKLGFTGDQLLRRPSPTAAGTGGGASVTAMAKWTQSSQSIGAGGTNINWASIDTTFDPDNHFDLTASADMQINDEGIYGLYFQITDVPTPTAGTSSKLFITADVTVGSAGLWSSQVSGAEFTGIMPFVIEDGNSNAFDAIGAGQIGAYAAWSAANTFPVKIEIFAQYTEDNVGVTKTLSFTCTMVRFSGGATGIPWVRLGQFSRDVSDSTWTTVPWRFAFYDPTTTTLGGVDFTLTQQSVGLAHNIWQIQSDVSGLYLYDLITSCTFSDPTVDAGTFALRLTDGTNELDEIYDSSDVFKSTVFTSGSQGEYLQTGRIRLSGMVYVANQNQIWKPQVQQTTGGTLAVGGEYFYLARLTANTDSGMTTLTTT